MDEATDKRIAPQPTAIRDLLPAVTPIRPPSSPSPAGSGDASATATLAAHECAACHGAGWLRQPQPDGGNRLMLCACQHEAARERRLRELLALSGLEPAMGRMTFASFQPGGNDTLAAALREARTFAAKPEGWLLLAGPYGTGKTHLLAAIAQALVERGQPVYYQYAPKFLTQLRATFREGWTGPSYDELAARITRADVLLLDDLGAEKGSEWALEQMTMLLDERYRAALPTAIASNLSPAQLGGRIGSRLSDVRLVTSVTLAAGDWRRN